MIRKLSLKNRIFKSTALILLIGFMVTCRTVPFSNRKQVNLLPESQLVGMSLTAYDDFLHSHTVISNTSESQMVKTVGRNIQNAVETFMKNEGQADLLKGFKWEFNLVKEDVPNAWCMAGGKVAVYTGILPFTKNDDGLAVVLGHEIAHAVARHGNERMSQEMLVQLGGTALAVALKEKPEQTQQMFLGAYGLGSSIGVLLPYSRTHESEADQLGLIFMAMAGYNPEAAIEFWQRMDNAGGSQPPEFLSTHPSHSRRISNLKKMMPKAMKYYHKQ